MPGQVLISELSSCQISTMLAHACQSRSSDVFPSREHSIALGDILEPHKTVLGALL